MACSRAATAASCRAACSGQFVLFAQPVQRGGDSLDERRIGESSPGRKQRVPLRPARRPPSTSNAACMAFSFSAVCRSSPRPCSRAAFERAAAIWEISDSGLSIRQAEFSSSAARAFRAVASPLAIACGTSRCNSLTRSSSKVRTSWSQIGFSGSASARLRRVSTRSLIGPWLIASRRCRCRSVASGCSTAYASFRLAATSSISAAGGERPCSAEQFVPGIALGEIEDFDDIEQVRLDFAKLDRLAPQAFAQKGPALPQTLVGLVDRQRVVGCRALQEIVPILAVDEQQRCEHRRRFVGSQAWSVLKGRS